MKWVSFRNEYDSRLHNEVEKLRQSLQKQIEMLRISGTEMMESRMLQTEHHRDKATQEINYWKNQ